MTVNRHSPDDRGLVRIRGAEGRRKKEFEMERSSPHMGIAFSCPPLKLPAGCVSRETLAGNPFLKES